MKKWLFFSMLVMNTVAFGQLFVVNKSNFDYQFAFVYFQDGATYSGLISQGWIPVKAGEKVKVLPENPTGKHLYFYAVSPEKEISGDAPMIVSKDTSKRFRIKNPDSESSMTDEMEWKNFIKVKRGMSRLYKTKETVELF